MLEAQKFQRVQTGVASNLRFGGKMKIIRNVFVILLSKRLERADYEEKVKAIPHAETRDFS